MRALIERAAPKAREVLLAGLRRFAIHPRQSAGRWTYLELCPAYLQTCVECCYETARRAWRELRGALGWWSVPPETAEGMGIRLRPLRQGQRHGQHLLIDPDLTPQLRDLALELGVLQVTPDALLHWEPVDPRRKGAGLVCRCPFHADEHPSMLLDPARRRATCLACGTVHRFDGGRVSSPIERAGPSPSPAPTSSTTEYPRRPRWVVGRIGLPGLTTGVVDGDLLYALAEADHKAARAAAPVMAGLRERPREAAPDLVAHLDAVEPTGWRLHRGRWRPNGHRPVAERFVAVDVDAIDLPPVLDAADGQQLAAAGQEIEAWARTRPELSGRVAVVHTSLHGVQVTLELQEDRPPGWRRGHGAALCDAAEAVVLAALERANYIGGHADPTARLGGRLIRRPGPRVDKRGQPWIARLRYLTPVEATCPRSCPSA